MINCKDICPTSNVFVSISYFLAYPYAFVFGALTFAFLFPTVLASNIGYTGICRSNDPIFFPSGLKRNFSSIKCEIKSFRSVIKANKNIWIQIIWVNRLTYLHFRSEYLIYWRYRHGFHVFLSKSHSQTVSGWMPTGKHRYWDPCNLIQSRLYGKSTFKLVKV